jgi:hypothetical protein
LPPRPRSWRIRYRWPSRWWPGGKSPPSTGCRHAWVERSPMSSGGPPPWGGCSGTRLFPFRPPSVALVQRRAGRPMGSTKNSPCPRQGRAVVSTTQRTRRPVSGVDLRTKAPRGGAGTTTAGPSPSSRQLAELSPLQPRVPPRQVRVSRRA